MRIPFPLRILSLALTLQVAGNTGTRPTTPVADALDWYSVWVASKPSPTPGAQTCRGELRGNVYSFRCDPLSVVVAVVVTEGGHCSITSMSPSISSDDGLRVQTLEYLIPPGIPVQKAGLPKDCGELPLKEGIFQLVIKPRPRPVDGTLTPAARDAALAYDKRSGDQSCLLRFPNVKTGDPFFHVYVECQGILDTIWEFTIADGQVAEFAHWYFSRRRGFPKGIEWRRAQPDLWLGVSRPEDRK